MGLGIWLGCVVRLGIVVWVVVGLGVFVVGSVDEAGDCECIGLGLEVRSTALAFTCGSGLGEGCQRHARHVDVGVTALAVVHAAISGNRIALAMNNPRVTFREK